MSKKALLNTKIFSIDDLSTANYNPRKDLHKEDIEYKQLKKSIKEFSYVDPLIFNEKTNTLISGHQRLKVMKELGYTEIEVNCVSLNERKEKALNIALNKIQGDWDRQKLSLLLEEITTDFNIDTNIIGFSDIEISELLEKGYNFENVINELEKGAFSNAVKTASDVFNITFSFPLKEKEFIQNKIKEKSKEYYTSKVLEVFYA